MVKLIGAVMTGFACVYFGFRMRMTLKTRYKSLENIYASLESLESEISFSVNRLEKALVRADKGGLFAYAAAGIKEKGAERAWTDAVREKAGSLCLTSADCDALMPLGKNMGKTGAEEQIKHIRYIKSLVSAQSEQAKNEYSRLGGLCSGGSVLLGALIVIVLM